MKKASNTNKTLQFTVINQGFVVKIWVSNLEIFPGMMYNETINLYMYDNANLLRLFFDCLVKKKM